MKRLVFLDLETTGLSPRSDSIVQIGAIGASCDQNGRFTTLSQFQTLVFTDQLINPTASKITGIYNTHLEGAPNTQCALKLFLNWLSGLRLVGEVYLIAYNGLKFDFQFLRNEMARCSIPFDSLAPAVLIDPLVLLRNTCPVQMSLKLADVHTRLVGRAILQAHTALADASALYAICECQPWKAALWTSGGHTVNWLEYLKKPSKPRRKKARLAANP